MRTQISTNVSIRTRAQADTLVRKHGYSLRDVVSIAIDRMYKQEIRKMHIKIEYSTASLFGTADPEEHDEAASIANWEGSLVDAFYDECPQAEVEIVHGIIDRHTVNGQTDHDECAYVGDLINKVWESWEWLEGK